MINLSYRFDQNSASLELAGMPDVSNGDAEDTIGILSSWTLKIIGSPLLEGEKDHLDNLMQVILEYSRSYISGMRQTFISNKKIVTISPLGKNHKLLLNSTKKGVKPLEIVLDDSELSDLTRCFDLIRFDNRCNIKWKIKLDRPFSKRYINNNDRSIINYNLIYSFMIFVSSCALFLFIPIDNRLELKETNINTKNSVEKVK
tara:strand:- start:33 stop:638 length:606 start_codon:yes stop_codon:yes gene_type:complete